MRTILCLLLPFSPTLSCCVVMVFPAVFYSLPSISDFIIDVLVGSPQEDIRITAVEQFLALSRTLVTPSECTGHQLTPRQFLLQTLLKARLPFWVSSTVTRGASYRCYRLVTLSSYIIDISCDRPSGLDATQWTLSSM